MDETIYVDHSALASAAESFGSLHSTFTGTLAELESDLQPLIETWSGSARDLYLAKQQQWNAAAADLAELLGSIAKLTSDAHSTYAQAVDNLTEMWT